MFSGAVGEVNGSRLLDNARSCRPLNRHSVKRCADYGGYMLAPSNAYLAPTPTCAGLGGVLQRRIAGQERKLVGIKTRALSGPSP